MKPPVSTKVPAADAGEIAVNNAIKSSYLAGP
jgi:hypothetical protein